MFFYSVNVTYWVISLTIGYVPHFSEVIFGYFVLFGIAACIGAYTGTKTTNSDIIIKMATTDEVRKNVGLPTYRRINYLNVICLLGTAFISIDIYPPLSVASIIYLFIVVIIKDDVLKFFEKTLPPSTFYPIVTFYKDIKFNSYITYTSKVSKDHDFIVILKAPIEETAKILSGDKSMLKTIIGGKMYFLREYEIIKKVDTGATSFLIFKGKPEKVSVN